MRPELIHLVCQKIPCKMLLLFILFSVRRQQFAQNEQAKGCDQYEKIRRKVLMFDTKLKAFLFY